MHWEWRWLASDAAARVAFTSVGLAGETFKKRVKAASFGSHYSRIVVAYESASKKTLPHLNRKLFFDPQYSNNLFGAGKLFGIIYI